MVQWWDCGNGLDVGTRDVATELEDVAAWGIDFARAGFEGDDPGGVFAGDVAVHRADEDDADVLGVGPASFWDLDDGQPGFLREVIGEVEIAAGEFLGQGGDVGEMLLIDGVEEGGH